jgi:PAS domain S-box-containing protein
MRARPRKNYNSLQQSIDLLTVINQTQSHILSKKNPREVFEQLLESILNLTQGEKGFIGEVLNQPQGRSIIKMVALAGIKWNEKKHAFEGGLGPSEMKVNQLKNLTGAVLKSGQPVIFNKPVKNSTRGKKPEGKMRLMSLLGLPVYHGQEMVGIIGLVNRQRGYDLAMASYLEPLLLTCGNMVESLRMNQRRQQAELALRESEERFRLMADTAPVMIWISDPDKRCTYFNKVWLEFTGRSMEQELGNGWAEGVHPDDFNRALNTCIAAFDARESFQMEYRLRSKNGEYRWIYDHGIPSYLPNGHFNGYIGSCMDITDRKGFEKEIQKERSKAQKYLDVAGAIFVLIGKNQVVKSINKKGCEVLGYVESDIVGKNWFDNFLPERIRDKVKGAFSSLISGHIQPVEYFENSVLTKDGQEKMIVWHNTVLRDEKGEINASLSSGVDITERKRIEEALRKSEKILELTLDSLSAHIAIADQTGTILGVNAAWRRFAENNDFKLPNYGIGQNYITLCESVSGFESEMAKMVSKAIRKILTGQRNDFRVEYPCHSPKEQRWFQLRLTRFESSNGIRLVMSHENITERMLAEVALLERKKALRKSEAELRFLTGRLISVREEELRRLARELHDDFSQRLAAFAIEIGKLEKQIGSSRDPVSKKLGEIKDQVVRLSSDVHGISRRLHPSILDDLGLVYAVESECRAFSEREGVSVRFSHKQVPKTLSKEVSLCFYRITQESLRNIVKHSGAQKAKVNLKGQNGNVILKIHDFGVGFDLSSKQGKGGLGLASMKERVRLIQGDLSIRSKPGEGTVIEVCSPIKVGGK